MNRTKTDVRAFEKVILLSLFLPSISIYKFTRCVYINKQTTSLIH